MTDALSEWADRNLGATPRRELFRTGHLSEVVGLVLSDGRAVVIKIRPSSPRLEAIAAIQRNLHDRGFPCPEVLAGPAPFGRRAATAETYVPPRGSPPAPVPAPATAELLARLVEMAPPASEFPALRTAPPWAGWDHEQGGLWPPPDDLQVDLNDHDGPEWVDDTARRVRDRLTAVDSQHKIGHLDWEAHNLDWDNDRPVLVHDWDSVAIRPEPTIAGVAAATFPSNGDSVVAATVEQTSAFLSAYRSQRKHWTTADTELAWCAGLWVLAYNAKKESVGGGPGYLDHLNRELANRMANAGL